MGRPARSDVDDLEITIRKQNAICSLRLLNALRLNHGDPAEVAEPEIEEELEQPASAPPSIEPEQKFPHFIAPVPHFPPETVARPLWFGMAADDDSPPHEPKIADIRRAACRYFNLDPVEICSARRTAKIVYPRQIAYYVSKSLTTQSLPEIGRRFGGRDHTTVLHGVRKIERLMRTDWAVAYDVAHIEASLA